ncbi:MAG: tRNA (adenosine(37)-N6)-threonylcarbamoyltransferase complex ATPase subunit type 1 TsaE [Rhodospirillales bacterium]|nr:tRNA (adenosine(37)-N6)-threonylcarbamoyltransferase complex ATPase subunit type 1 TsaE [Rhodospirillales bacterium]
MPDAYPTAPPDGAEFGLADLAATGRLARAVAMQARPGDVIGLWGGLGLGKTSFARAFIRAGGAESEEVPSPTFTLVQVYDLSDAAVWHFDLARLVGHGPWTARLPEIAAHV